MLRSIYVVKNYTLKEVYFGTTRHKVRESLSDLRHHRARDAAHWDWDAQDIEWRIVSRRVPAPLAAALVWRLKHKERGGWKTV
jgi:hypothetical protein